ncbi:hypothetical protein GCM10027082_33590 [Comamonas humi]
MVHHRARAAQAAQQSIGQHLVVFGYQDAHGCLLESYGAILGATFPVAAERAGRCTQKRRRVAPFGWLPTGGLSAVQVHIRPFHGTSFFSTQRMNRSKA